MYDRADHQQINSRAVQLAGQCPPRMLLKFIHPRAIELVRMYKLSCSLITLWSDPLQCSVITTAASTKQLVIAQGVSTQQLSSHSRQHLDHC